MFYSFIRGLVRILILIINGNTHYENKEALPDGPYVLVGPHRTWLDPVFFGLAASPRQFAVMGKDELFKNPVLGWFLRHMHAFGVNRANPGPSAIKTPVRLLKQGQLSVMLFPSGSRYANDLKGGAVLIAKLAKVPIVPAVYQGPIKFSHVLLRKRITVRFGEPIEVPAGRVTDEMTAQMGLKMQQAFDAIDKEIDPNFKYVPDQKKYLAEKEEGKVK